MNHAVLRILAYHRISASSRAVALSPIVSTTAEVFDLHMRHLARGYRVVSAARVRNAFVHGFPLPPKAVLITFDDAYRDFAEVAFPILRRYGLPATLFVPTAFPGEPSRAFWWDRLHAAFARSRRTTLMTPVGELALGSPQARRSSLKRVQSHVKGLPHERAMALVDQLCEDLGNGDAATAQTLGWDELRRLAGDGVTLGAHTRTHPSLTGIAEERVRQEVRGSRADLLRETGRTPFIFAFPYGSYDDRAVSIVREQGFDLAVVGGNGYNRVPGAQPHRLSRLNVGRRTSPAVLSIRLRPSFRPLERLYRALA